MKHLAEFPDVPGRGQQSGPMIHHAMDLLHLFGILLEILDLRLCNLRCNARESGEEEHKMAFELVLASLGKDQRLDTEIAILPEVDDVEPSGGGGDLVLRSDMLGQHAL